MLDPINLRHFLHQNPELSFKEYKTTDLLIDNIRKISNKLKILTPLETGFIVDYRINSYKYILIRADIDALPIKEMTQYQFKSRNDYMHACGHDVHTAILYGLIKSVIKEKIQQNILFLFQPAEEEGAGAKNVINSGVLSEYQIRFAFALHVTDEYPYEVIVSHKGSLFASSLELDIDFTGKSAHITEPENGINSLNALRIFLDESEKISNKYKDKILFGVGRVSAGENRNIIPDYAIIKSTIRGIDTSVITNFIEELFLISLDLEHKYDINIKFREGQKYPNVKIDSILYDRLKPVLSSKYNWMEGKTTFKAEDFGFYSQIYPSFYFWLGSRQNKSYGLHSPYFLPPDSIIDVGINVFKSIINEIIIT